MHAIHMHLSRREYKEYLKLGIPDLSLGRRTESENWGRIEMNFHRIQSAIVKGSAPLAVNESCTTELSLRSPWKSHVQAAMIYCSNACL